MAPNDQNVDLLDRVLKRHGGLERWSLVEKITLHAKTGGVALPLRFKFGAFKNYDAEIHVHAPRVRITPHPKAGMQGIFDGDAVRIETDKGETVQERRKARSAFKGFRHKLWWDHLDTIHFAGYALWNYLTTPFLLRLPGIQIKEISPWNENNESWQRLQVNFPPELLTHSPEQTFYFDSQGLLRRHDYTAMVFGDFAKAAHYSGDHKEFDGIPFPLRRRVFPRKKDGSPLRLVTLVSIDIADIQVHLK